MLATMFSGHLVAMGPTRRLISISRRPSQLVGPDRPSSRPCIYIYIYIYIYMEIISYSQGVVTSMCISLDLGCIWPDEVYVDGVYHHTRPSRVLCMTSMYVYLEYIVILILYATIIVLYNILKICTLLNFFST